MMPGISRGRRWTYGLLTAGALGLVIFGQQNADHERASAALRLVERMASP